MSARLFRKTWWIDFQFNSVRYRVRSPANFRAGAKAYEAIIRNRLAQGLPIEGNQPAADDDFLMGRSNLDGGRRRVRYAKVDRNTLQMT